MEKKRNSRNNKVTPIKPKVSKNLSKPAKKKLGMGLSSLLSADSALDSIVGKSSQPLPDKEKKQFDQINDRIKILSNKNIAENFIKSDGQQINVPIHSLISGKYQPRKTFDQSELE